MAPPAIGPQHYSAAVLDCAMQVAADAGGLNSTHEGALQATRGGVRALAWPEEASAEVGGKTEEAPGRSRFLTHRAFLERLTHIAALEKLDIAAAALSELARLTYGKGAHYDRLAIEAMLRLSKFAGNRRIEAQMVRDLLGGNEISTEKRTYSSTDLRQPIGREEDTPAAEEHKALARKAQAVLETFEEPDEQADRIVTIADRLVKSQHVTLNPRMADRLERLRRSTKPAISRDAFHKALNKYDGGRENQEHCIREFISALLGETDDERFEQCPQLSLRDADEKDYAKGIKHAVEYLKKTDPDVAALRERIFATKKLTASTVHKVLKPVQRRCDAELYAKLLEAVTIQPARLKTDKGKTDFFEATTSAIASRWLLEQGVTKITNRNSAPAK